MSAAADPWGDILDEGERILWQGRPDGAVVWRPQNLFVAAFGLVFAGFALVWMIGVAAAGGAFWAFGLIHFAVGLGLVAGPSLFGAFRRRRTWYTLTDRRAFIATDLPVLGKSLRSYPITEDTVIDFRPGEPATINFAHEYRRTKNGSRRVDVGFERIGDGAEVLALMRRAQRRDAG